MQSILIVTITKLEDFMKSLNSVNVARIKEINFGVCSTHILIEEVYLE